MKTVEFKWEYPEKLEPAINYNGRYLILEGGRGSAKSHFIARRELIKRVNVRRDLICIRISRKFKRI
jgi:phage terminase large subunit